ncbi:uncharacterized protein [Euphorbia lathyris]|uniref:uncharacterized protein isoform X4 n=1 Tax=Euphorbia lathyris TaxID=212925 RepID=UPI0033144C0A
MSRNLKLSFVKLWFCTSRISQSPIESVRPRSFLSFGFFTVLLQEPRSRVQVLDMLMIDLLLCLFAGILSIGIGDTCQIEDFSLLGQAFSIPIQNEASFARFKSLYGFHHPFDSCLQEDIGRWLFESKCGDTERL